MALGQYGPRRIMPICLHSPFDQVQGKVPSRFPWNSFRSKDAKTVSTLREVLNACCSLDHGQRNCNSSRFKGMLMGRGMSPSKVIQIYLDSFIKRISILYLIYSYLAYVHLGPMSPRDRMLRIDGYFLSLGQQKRRNMPCFSGGKEKHIQELSYGNTSRQTVGTKA